MQQKQPRIGDTVHYVLHAGPAMGEHRPAVVVKTEEGVDLQVFASGNGKLGDRLPNVFWRYRVPADAAGQQVGSWHWPEHDRGREAPQFIAEGGWPLHD